MSDNEQPGATPEQPGATPQTEGVKEPAQPATGEAEGLGDGGKKALESERKAAREALKRAETAEKELEKLRQASQSDQEKALDTARKEGAAEAAKAAAVRIRRAEVRRSLTAAGIQATELALAATASEFGDLEVDDEGEVAGLDEAVNAFKAAHPSLFGKPAASGSMDGGVRGKSSLTLDEIKRMTPEQHAARRTEVMEFMASLNKH